MNQYAAGKELVNYWYTLVKATQIYEPRNDVVVGAAARLTAHLGKIYAGEGAVELLRFRDYIFYNKLRLRFEIEGYAGLQYLNESFKRLGIRSLAVFSGITDEEAVRFAMLFREDASAFASALNAVDFPHVTVSFSTGEEDVPEFLRDRQQAKRAYYKALKTTKNLIQNLWSNQPVNINSFRRVVYTLIESISRDELGITALAAIKNFDEYTYNHSLNVGVLALAMGQHLGMSRASLVKLGTAGLLHDIGKVEIDKELLYKIERLSEEEWQRIQHHSLFSVRQIIKTRGLDEVSISALVSAYQHHWNYNGTGYPARDADKDVNPTFLARIIRICDAFDAMTTPRPYHPIPYIPTIAVRVIWERSGTYFDPLLTKVFVQLFGIYPIGSCVEFESGEVGVVIRQNAGWIDRPVVKIVLDRDRREAKQGPLDLSVIPQYRIRRPVYPQEFRISPADHLA